MDSFQMYVRPFSFLVVVVLQNEQHKLNCLENSIPAAWNKCRCMGKKNVILTSHTCVCVRNFVDFCYFRCTIRRNLAPFFTWFTISLSCVHRQTQFTPFKIVFQIIKLFKNSLIIIIMTNCVYLRRNVLCLQWFWRSLKSANLFFVVESMLFCEMSLHVCFCQPTDVDGVNGYSTQCGALHQYF